MTNKMLCLAILLFAPTLYGQELPSEVRESIEASLADFNSSGISSQINKAANLVGKGEHKASSEILEALLAHEGRMTPDQQINCLHVLNQCYLTLGRFSEAVRTASMLLDNLRKADESESLTSDVYWLHKYCKDLENADADRAMELVRLDEKVRSLVSSGELRPALKAATSLLQSELKLLPSGSPFIANSHKQIGRLYADLEEYESSAHHYKDAVGIYESALLATKDELATPRLQAELAENSFMLGHMLSFQRKWSEAIAAYEKASEVYKNDFDVARVELHKGICQMELNDQESNATLERSLITFRRLLFDEGNRGQASELAYYANQAFCQLNTGWIARRVEASKLYSNSQDALRDKRYFDALVNLELLVLLDRKRYINESKATTASQLWGSYAMLASVRSQLGLHTEAIDAIQQAIEYYNDCENPNATELAMLFKRLSGAYRSAADFLAAEEAMQNAIVVLTGEDRSTLRLLALCKTDLGSLYLDQGNMLKAREMLEGAKAANELAFPEKDPLTRTCLITLGTCYQRLGDFKNAEAMYLAAVAIGKGTSMVDAHEYAIALKDLGQFYFAQGSLERAEKSYSDAIRVFEGDTQKANPLYSEILSAIATLRAETGDTVAARSLFQKVQEIDEATYGKNHRMYATTLSNLSRFEYFDGNYDKAIRLASDALAIRQKVDPPNYREIAYSLNNLSSMLSATGDSSLADSLMFAANDALRSSPGAGSPDYARSSVRVARRYLELGKIDIAESLLVNAREVFQTLGEDHVDLFECLASFSILRLAQGRIEEALEYSGYVSDGALRQFRSFSSIQSERRQIAMQQDARRFLDIYLNICSKSGRFTEASAERVLRWKNAVIQQQMLTRAIRNTPEGKRLSLELADVLIEQASLRSADIVRNSGEWKTRLQELVEKRDRAEAELMSLALTDQSDGHPQTISLESICDAIPLDAVLIDYIEFKTTEGHSMLATVLTKEGPPVQVQLGLPIQDVDVNQLVDRWRDGYGMNPDSQRAGEELRSLLWDPLIPFIATKKNVFICQDGSTSRIAFNALPGKANGSHLIEEFRISCVPEPRWFLREGKKQEDSLGSSILLVGDVDYGESSLPSKDTPTWPKLEHTGAEIKSIEELFRQKHGEKLNVSILASSRATESDFKAKVAGANLIHLATHGFFTSADRIEGKQGVRANGEMVDPISLIEAYAPGQLSGIVLADANNYSKPATVGSTRESQDDGLVNADEMALLDFSKAELAVLSACETGLGKNAGAEGLLGLQRAMHVAGASTTITTLWKIDDPSAQKIMEKFYSIYLVGGKSPLDALHEAQIWAIRNPNLFPIKYRTRGLPEPKTSETALRLSPEVWAPFVASGGSFSK